MEFLLSSSFWFSVLASTTPVMLATLAANIVSQAGIFNLAIEGTMLICALAGVLGSAWTGNLLVGAVAGLFFGILVSFILGYFTLVMRGPMNACGVAINLVATGGTVFVLVLTAGSKITSSSLVSKTFPNVKIPGLSAIPFIGKVLSGHNFLTYVEMCIRDSRRSDRDLCQCAQPEPAGRIYDRPGLHPAGSHGSGENGGRRGVFRQGSQRAGREISGGDAHH